MDVQFIQFQDALSLTGASEVPGLLPRTLQLDGPDFRSAVEVFINDEESPSFVVASKTRILAQVPDSQTKSVIRSVSVLSNEFTATIRSTIRFLIGDEPKAVTGLRAMMQQFLKILFTTPGTDAFAKKVGGAGLKNIGKNFDPGSTSSLTSDFAIAVRRAEQQMRALQSRQSRLPDDEKLLSAELLHVKFDVQSLSLIARIELISQSGIRAITNLEL